LDSKNQQLEKSNEELSSFNFIASHDLREPLRKIKTYNCILSSDQSKYSEYVQKMDDAINRMQNLLNDLLSYSRISMGERKFETVDLNKLVAEVIETMQDQIVEADAKGNIDNLPVLNGIPFQLQQLFENFLSNAIKYRKEDVTPNINITCQLIDKNQLPIINTKYDRYYKISFSDNGIGFEQKYSEKCLNYSNPYMPSMLIQERVLA